MLLLASTSDLISVITSDAVTTDVHASWVDLSGTTVTPGRTNTPISTAATTTIVGSPSASTYRTVKTLTIRNRHATTQQTVTVVHDDGTNAMELCKWTLLAGDQLHYHEGAGFWVTNSQGQTKINSSANGSGAAVNSTNLVVLAADVVNNNASANTIADITGLEFNVTAGEGYWFRFNIAFTSAATSTGSRWSINGPAAPTLLVYRSRYSLAATTQTQNSGLAAYDLPAASNASSASTGANIAVVEGLIEPSVNGTVVGRFASEISASAITALKGSLLEWYRVY